MCSRQRIVKSCRVFGSTEQNEDNEVLIGVSRPFARSRRPSIRPHASKEYERDEMRWIIAAGAVLAVLAWGWSLLIIGSRTPPSPDDPPEGEPPPPDREDSGTGLS